MDTFLSLCNGCMDAVLPGGAILTYLDRFPVFNITIPNGMVLLKSRYLFDNGSFIPIDNAHRLAAFPKIYDKRKQEVHYSIRASLPKVRYEDCDVIHSISMILSPFEALSFGRYSTVSIHSLMKFLPYSKLMEVPNGQLYKAYEQLQRPVRF